jgi:hypothetical protein
MNDMASRGVRSVREMQRHVQQYVSSAFPTASVTSHTDGNYCPNVKSILNCIYRAAVRDRYFLDANMLNVQQLGMFLDIQRCEKLKAFDVN